MSDIIETLSQEIAQVAEDPEEARHIVSDLVKVDWQSYFLGGKAQAQYHSNKKDIVSLAKGWLGFASVSSSVPNYEREHP